MKVLVTGAAGFIGKNLVERFRNGSHEDTELLLFTLDSSDDDLAAYCSECDFVFHLAGVNRPQDPAEFVEGNVDLTAQILNLLAQRADPCPVLLSSSAQASLDNPYGASKLAAEETVRAYGRDTGAEVFIYRLPGVFGKWSQPNYNSVVATFCHNVARDLPISVSNPATALTLAYIDDVVDEFLRAKLGEATRVDDGFCEVPVTHEVTLGRIVELLAEFRAGRETLEVPDTSDAFTLKLYATYLSHLPADAFSYPLDMNVDERGSFTEIIRSADRGQFSVNVIKPGITKGNHWHDTKNEKFAVVSGRGVIRFRKVGESEINEYPVSGDRIEVVDIPPGYTHSIENLGDADMVTFMWANECFDPDRPDTYWLEV
ncbi:MAG: NAD-dependent epimerase/dehydratase family protein [Coriobacteriia bacterium]|nr:NAD-dependent epimerase/dehydratase family protein [Coriobacteriia bacterium]